MKHPLPPATRQRLIQLGAKCCGLREKIDGCRDTSKLAALHNAYEQAQEKLARFEAQLQGGAR